jgi:hypothetical protein
MSLPDDVVLILREFSAATSHLWAREMDACLVSELHPLGQPFYKRLRTRGLPRARAARLLGGTFSDDRQAWRARRLVA